MNEMVEEAAHIVYVDDKPTFMIKQNGTLK